MRRKGVAKQKASTMSILRKTDTDCNNEAERLERFLASFRDSNKPGNIWTRYDGKTISIFCNKYRKYQWCITDAATVTYSRESFASQEDAGYALLEMLEGGA